MKNPVEVVVFACNWDGLSCVEAAAHGGLCYPASVKVVRVSCLSRVHVGLMLKAFEVGAAGVMLLGCEPGRCHYDIENQCISKEFEKAQDIMRLLGLGPGRLVMTHMSRGDGAGFVERVNELVSEMSSLRSGNRFSSLQK
jgi:heterodisulfide reductase subunit A/F420-non-reducing hydrogenase iron-sulfur subunit